MNKLFRFDVTLKDLMNLGERAKNFPKLGMIFEFLKGFWYTLKDKEAEQERWANVRVGSIEVYLDEHKHLCMEFATRFQFRNSPEILEFFEKFKD